MSTPNSEAPPNFEFEVTTLLEAFWKLERSHQKPQYFLEQKNFRQDCEAWVDLKEPMLNMQGHLVSSAVLISGERIADREPVRVYFTGVRELKSFRRRFRTATTLPVNPPRNRWVQPVVVLPSLDSGGDATIILAHWVATAMLSEKLREPR